MLKLHIKLFFSLLFFFCLEHNDVTQVTFFQMRKLLSCKFNEEQIFSIGECVHLWIEGPEAKKLSRDRGAKRQTSARSANARATPGWPAGDTYTEEESLAYHQ